MCEHGSISGKLLLCAACDINACGLGLKEPAQSGCNLLPPHADLVRCVHMWLLARPELQQSQTKDRAVTSGVLKISISSSPALACACITNCCERKVCHLHVFNLLLYRTPCAFLLLPELLDCGCEARASKIEPDEPSYSKTRGCQSAPPCLHLQAPPCSYQGVR